MNKNKKIIFIFLVIVIIGVIFIFEKAKDPIIEHPYVLLHGEKIFVEIADTEEKREKGLSGRDSIGEDEGMLFLFLQKGKYGFWMKGMKFPIDIIWISGNKVVGVEKNVNPQIDTLEQDLKVYSPQEDVDKVLEIKAGESEKFGISSGGELLLTL